MFVNILTAHDKFSLLNRDNSRQPIQIQLSQKKFFFEFLLTILKSRLNFEHFPKNMTIIADVFPKNVVI